MPRPVEHWRGTLFFFSPILGGIVHQKEVGHVWSVYSAPYGIAKFGYIWACYLSLSWPPERYHYTQWNLTLRKWLLQVQILVTVNKIPAHNQLYFVRLAGRYNACISTLQSVWSNMYAQPSKKKPLRRLLLTGATEIFSRDIILEGDIQYISCHFCLWNIQWATSKSLPMNSLCVF